MAPPYYRTVTVPLPQWQLPTKKPRVLVAQLSTRYRAPDGSNGRIRLDVDADYISRLYATVAQMHAQQAHILLFPEFAWPFVNYQEAFGHVACALPKMAACIMPFEHLTLAEFGEFVRGLPIEKKHARRVLRDVTASVAPAEQDRALVNVAVLVIRLNEGVVAFLQPKTRPAGLEEPKYLGTKLAGGRNRYIFQGKGFTVAIAVCFDLIARDDAHGEHPREAMIVPPNLLLVPECNPSPLHETYARAIVDLYEQPQWARAQALIVFANVAASSALPGVKDARFGFSRCVGPLGATTPLMRDVFFVVNGIIAHPNPVSLTQVRSDAEIITTKAFSWLIARPEQSLVSIEVPTMDSRPTGDPLGGRTDTEVSVLRWAAGPAARWHGIRAALDPPTEERSIGVPAEHLADLVGADQVVDDFLCRLHAAPRPLWAFGEGGIGKTATVANALHHAVEKPGLARIVWLDMAQLARRSEALVEALLVQLGLVRGLRVPLVDQWKVIASNLRSSSTVVVLDSFERWGMDEVPPELCQLHGWPVRLVVTARREGSNDVENFPIPALSHESRLELLRRIPGIATVGDLQTLEAALGSTPLGIVWFRGLMETSPAHAVQIAAGLPAGADEQAVFDWCVRDLTDTGAAILSVVNELPAPVSREDITAITGEPPGEIEAAVRRLGLLNVVAAAGGGFHTRHPFVRQFWSTSPRAALDATHAKVLTWVDRTLSDYGDDRNWLGYTLLEARWANVRATLDQLQSALHDPPRRTFLRLWRLADYFLWSRGRLRERLELGRAAADVARALDERAALAHALFDSIAETLWHREGPSDECLQLLYEAESIYADLGDHRGLAMVMCYRSRLLRKMERLQEAHDYAFLAVNLAKCAQDAHASGHAMNALGNVLRDRQQRSNARTWYQGARRRFRKAKDPELQAVVERNLGRCAMDAFDYAEALVRFEGAMDDFRKLGLIVEEAEVGMYRGLALLRLGERAEAVSQLQIAKQLFERVGAVGRVGEVEQILAAEGR